MPTFVARTLWGRFVVALAAACLVLLLVEPALACPSCGKAVARQDNGRSLEAGYQASILLLMSTPFVILGGLAALFSWEIRKAKLRAAAQAGGGSNDADGPTAG